MNGEPLRVLALATYPDHAAATRYRVSQYTPLLAEMGIAVDVRPFLTNRVFARMYDRAYALATAGGIAAGVARRTGDVVRLGKFDVAFVQREAALVGPPVVEWLVQRRMPMVLDLDDATYLSRPSDVYGPLTSLLKWSGKTDRLIDWSTQVTAGNAAVASYAAGRGKPATILPTIVDVERWTPRERTDRGDLVIGWMGTHSTFAYFRMLFPVLRRLAERHRVRVRIVGAGVDQVPLDGIHVELLPWSLDREIADVQSFDVAVYPILADAWAEGKSGFKSIQYLSCGVPYVASPVGAAAEIGVPGRTHLEATTEDEWVSALSRLLEDGELRTRMGRAGRAYAVEQYSLPRAAASLGKVLRDVAQQKSDRPPRSGRLRSC